MDTVQTAGEPRRRSRLITAGMALISGLLLATSASGAQAQSSWAATATQAPNLVKATAIGHLAGSTPLHIAVGLRLRNATALNTFIRDLSTPGTAQYKHYLTPAQFRDRYSPTAAQAAAVRSYLSGQGFTNVKVESNRLYVTADGTAATAERAFDTQLERYTQHGTVVYANTGTAMVPRSLRNTVVAVLGLNSTAHMNVSTPSRPADTVGTIKGYYARDYWKAYGVGKVGTGKSTPIAIFAEGDLTQVLKDLRTYERDPRNNLPAVAVSVVRTGIASPDTAAADEWDLDTQTSTGIAGNVNHLYVYDATSLTDGDIAVEFNRFVTGNKARAGSASFGECEYSAWADGFMVQNDQVMAEAAAQGQTVFASAGDTGGFCPVAPTNGVPAGVPVQGYPASSPYVVAVGGTTLLTNADGTYNNEAAWVAGGGGPSAFEYQPYWQAGITPPTSETCVQVILCLGRNVPDVAMDSDPNTGAIIYVGGSTEQIGGTSLGSPLTLGVWSRLETGHNNTLGFASPRLYAMAASAGFHDVTLGDNGPYPATPGWDYATGLGSFDITPAATFIAHPPVTPVPPATIAAPECRVWTDPAADSHPLGSTNNVDSMDLRAAGLSSNATDINATLRVLSLSSGPAGKPEIGGDGDNWYVTFKYGATLYWLGAQYPGTTPDPNDPTLLVDYSYGTVDTSPTGGTLYNTVGTATGWMDVAHDVIHISTKLANVGKAPKHAMLTQTGGQTLESIGTPAGGLLEAADSAGPGSNYKVGTHC